MPRTPPTSLSIFAFFLALVFVDVLQSVQFELGLVNQLSHVVPIQTLNSSTSPLGVKIQINARSSSRLESMSAKFKFRGADKLIEASRVVCFPCLRVPSGFLRCGNIIKRKRLGT